MMGRKKLFFLGGVLVAEVAAYVAWRPRMLRWGTEGDEATEPLPGDDVLANPRCQSTRAITIDAPPERVWPWIVQMGIYRAGFYTHDRVERLMFRARYVEGKHSATRIHPELQDLKVGDLVPYGGGVHAVVNEIEPNRHLVAGEAFVLRPLPGNRTRFIMRYRGIGYISAAFEGLAADAPAVTKALALTVRRVPGGMLLARGVDFFIGDPLHHYMEVGVLRGTKKRAEGAFDDVDDGHATTPAAVGPRRPQPEATSTEVTATPRPVAMAGVDHLVLGHAVCAPGLGSMRCDESVGPIADPVAVIRVECGQAASMEGHDGSTGGVRRPGSDARADVRAGGTNQTAR